ncbi:hypothetical protein KAS42_05430 [bacterium]|nr:hypothetical protein [bacterium]
MQMTQSHLRGGIGWGSLYRALIPFQCHWVEDVLEAGATAVAVCSVVTKTVEPSAICRALKQKITAFGNE